MGYLDYAGLQYLWGKLKEKFAPKSHSHDDRYYTESEMDGKLNSKVNNNEAGANGLFSKLTTSWTATPTDDTYFIRQDTGGGNQFGRVKFSTLWNYIKGKADGTYQPKGNYAASNHSHTKDQVGLGNVDNTADRVKSVAVANFAKGTYINQYKTVNLTDLDQNTWYPVTGTGVPYNGLRHFKCNVQLNSGSKPSWSTHSSGFTAVVDILEESSGWGTTRMLGEVLINDQFFIADESKPPVGYQQMSYGSVPVWWLRGGGTYFLATDYDCTWTIQKSKYENSGQSVAPTTTYPGVNVNRATITANLNGNAKTATMANSANALSGLSSRSSQRWGVQTGTFVHGEDDSTGGSMAFRRDCPNGGQLSMVIDGRFYQNEGQYRVLDESDKNQFATAGHTHDMSMLTGNIINTEPATNNHKIVLGKSGLDKCEFYEYGGIWNFYKMSSGEPNLVASIQSDGIHATLKGTADAANSVDWSKVQNKPSSYAPASHTHDDRYYTESEVNTKLANYQPKGNYAAASHTHNYAGSGTAGGSANSAVKLDSSAGSATQPVYFKDGKPVATTYALNKTVPADAKFTDTNTWRGIQNNLTSDSTDQSLSAAQGKALKTLVDGKAPASHKHTKSQITDFPTSMPASDVSAWAKAATKPSYTKAEVGLGNVDNTADKDKSVKYATSAGSATTGLNGVSTCIFDLSSNNGSCVRFYNGLQICFGNSSKSSGVVFKLPFANDNYAVVVGGSDTLKNAWYVAGGRTTTGFNPNQSGFAVLFHWIAIGNWK